MWLPPDNRVQAMSLYTAVITATALQHDFCLAILESVPVNSWSAPVRITVSPQIALEHTTENIVKQTRQTNTQTNKQTKKQTNKRQHWCNLFCTTLCKFQ